MAENNQRFNIQELAEKWAQGKLTPEEKVFLEQWYAGFDDENITITDSDHANSEALRKAMLERINTQIQKEETPIRKILTFGRIVAAASVLFVLGIGAYQIFIKPKQIQIAQTKQQDIAPGSNKAILKMANGKTVIITDAKNGLVAQRGNTTISKVADGQLAYESTAGNKTGVTLYDTLIVPRGGQHQVKFADGSIAYLDADSKLRIPENFKGSDRTVELISGRAYFKVVHNASQPFKVIVRGQVTTDIGTEFNISAYSDEPIIKTTLLEGSIEVSKNNQTAVIKPGQQVQAGNAQFKVINGADTEEAIAWHKGLFQFHDASIQTVMAELSRWYDVDIAYEGNIPNRRFTGKLYRNVNALKIADILSYSQIHFRIEGKKIIVTP